MEDYLTHNYFWVFRHYNDVRVNKSLSGMMSSSYLGAFTCAHMHAHGHEKLRNR